MSFSIFVYLAIVGAVAVAIALCLTIKYATSLGNKRGRQRWARGSVVPDTCVSIATVDAIAEGPWTANTSFAEPLSSAENTEHVNPFLGDESSRSSSDGSSSLGEATLVNCGSSCYRKPLHSGQGLLQPPPQAHIPRLIVNPDFIEQLFGSPLFKEKLSHLIAEGQETGHSVA